MKPLHPQTYSIRTGIEEEPNYGAVIPPLYLTTTYAFKGFKDKREFDYIRSGNPNRSTLARALTHLENGDTTVLTSSGTSAILLLLTTLLESNDLLVAAHDCYGGTIRLINSLAQKNHFKVLWLDLTHPSALDQIKKLQPKAIWIESPSNPLLRITDIRKISTLAQKLGALTIVDSTFLSPILQKPLTLGADIVLHSTTKFINGHSDVIGGAVITKNRELGEHLLWWANTLGITSSPFDDYLILRGLRTLQSRMRQHSQNALSLAEFLVQSPAIKAVYYPGLTSHPHHNLALSQLPKNEKGELLDFTGFGGIVSFEIAASDKEIALFLEQLTLFSLAESLGGTESLISHSVSMTHAAMTEEELQNAGVNSQLFRLSVGLEYAEDLIQDLARALAVIKTS